MWRRHHRPTTPPSLLAITTTTIIVVFTLTIFFYAITTRKPSIPQFQHSSELKWNSFESSVQFNPTVEQSNGTDLIYQIPDSPRAVLFLAHGCGRRAADFWDRSPGCPHCSGLPEDRLIVLHALHRRFAVLTVSSSAECWSLGRETRTVRWIIKRWVESNGLAGLPLAAMGASSGGYFVSALAASAEMGFSSIAIMIAEGAFEDTKKIRKGYPPTLFLHMPKDRRRMRLVELNMGALRRAGVPVREVRCAEFPLTPEFLSDRIPALDRKSSVELFALFRNEGFIDENGYMRKDGRSTNWKEAVKRSGLLPEKFQWEGHIEEELNLAFGYHEMTSLQSDDMFDWFESHMS
ncbi:uncharacterized protein M6B38_382670 [Iris pallida]|uniref:Uncharacterized protein n=1 Tax=Iris pallida TaxID=29817 RepID=A0AAX6G7P0_IRIPA|nr:uncharacterized protein M6B38_382670 [Iris pallida]